MAITCNGKLQRQYNRVSAAARSAPHCCVFFIIIITIVTKCKDSFKWGHKSLSDMEICAPMSFLLTTVCCHGNRRQRLASKQVTFIKETTRCCRAGLYFPKRRSTSRSRFHKEDWNFPELRFGLCIGKETRMCAHHRFIVSNWCRLHAAFTIQFRMMAGGQFLDYNY